MRSTPSRSGNQTCTPRSESMWTISLAMKARPGHGAGDGEGLERLAFGQVHEDPLLVVGQPDPGVPCTELTGGGDDERGEAVRRDLVRRFEELPTTRPKTTSEPSTSCIIRG